MFHVKHLQFTKSSLEVHQMLASQLLFSVYFCTMQNNYADRMGWHIAHPSANGIRPWKMLRQAQHDSVGIRLWKMLRQAQHDSVGVRLWKMLHIRSA